MKIECPGCGGSCEVKPQLIGRTVTCPDCGNDFKVENPNLAPCPDCFSPVSRRAAVCPHCGAPLSAAAASGGRPVAGSPLDMSAEKEIMVCHPDLMNYLGTIILGILTIPFIFGILILLYVWIEIHFTSYRITTLRIVVRRGWIAKAQSEIWIKDMRGANLNQGIWQRLIGVGDIMIGTAATAGTEIAMRGIARPQAVVDKINALRY